MHKILIHIMEKYKSFSDDKPGAINKHVFNNIRTIPGPSGKNRLIKLLISKPITRKKK